jgi:hypothetical protein
MTQEHPITPPPELVQEWSCDCPSTDPFNRELYVATLAARWGADQELEACCSQLAYWGVHGYNKLYEARRPKLQSQAEEALIALEQTVTLLMPVTGREKIERFDTIRAALKRLRELERTVAD